MENDATFSVKFDQVDIGYALIDSTNGHLIKVNKKFCDIVGLEKDAAEETSFVDIAHPGDLQTNLKNMQRLLEGGLNEITIEKKFFRKDGAQVFCNLTIASLSEVDELPTYHLAVFEDISERKCAENQLKKINDMLAQRVQNLTTELDAKISELEATRKLLKEEVVKLRETN